MALTSYRDALNQAMREEMAATTACSSSARRPAKYDGAYEVSQGLLKEFGPWRVVDTPIAELGFAGVGIGAAIGGLRPIFEMMTWKMPKLSDQMTEGKLRTAAKPGAPHFYLETSADMRRMVALREQLGELTRRGSR